MWPLLRVTSAPSAFALSKWSSRLLAHAMLSTAQSSSVSATCFASKVIHDGEAFGLDALFHPRHNPFNVYPNENRPHG